MAVLSYAGANVELDHEGYLVRTDDWTPDVAEAVAQMVGLRLSPDHWRLINAVREHHAIGRDRLDLEAVAARTGVDPEMIRDLFPGATVDLICRVAGVPRPGTTRDPR